MLLSISFLPLHPINTLNLIHKAACAHNPYILQLPIACIILYIIIIMTDIENTDYEFSLEFVLNYYVHSAHNNSVELWDFSD